MGQHTYSYEDTDEDAVGVDVSTDDSGGVAIGVSNDDGNSGVVLHPDDARDLALALMTAASIAERNGVAYDADSEDAS
jgi:hypothetical protein